MDLICIRKYYNRYEAELDLSLLLSCDIPAMVKADDLAGMYPFLNYAKTGVQLLVNSTDADEAAALLDAQPEAT